MYLALLPVVLVIAQLASFPLISSRLDIATGSTPVCHLQVTQKTFLYLSVNNTLAERLNMTYVTEVIDQNGYTDYVKSLNSTLEGLQATGLANTWVANYAGNYTANGYVFANLDRSALIAEPQTLKISVFSSCQ
jgi:hypothetical protein